MTAPVQSQPEVVEGRQELSMDEMEQLSTAKPVDLTKVELGDTAGLGTFKGKTAAELIAHAKALEDSLRASERQRTQAEQIATLAQRTAPVPPPAPPVVPEGEKLATDEEIAQLYEENPLKAIKVMAERSARLAEQSMRARLEPLVTSSSASAEAAARAKYAEDFAIFGDQIQETIKLIPNASAAMSNPASWDDLIAYVRGKPGNFEKLYEHRQTKDREKAATVAQQQQHQSVGFSPMPTGRQPIFRADGSPDATAQEIADKLGLTWEEYVKWSKVG